MTKRKKKRKKIFAKSFKAGTEVGHAEGFRLGRSVDALSQAISMAAEGVAERLWANPQQRSGFDEGFEQGHREGAQAAAGQELKRLQQRIHDLEERLGPDGGVLKFGEWGKGHRTPYEDVVGDLSVGVSRNIQTQEQLDRLETEVKESNLIVSRKLGWLDSRDDGLEARLDRIERGDLEQWVEHLASTVAQVHHLTEQVDQLEARLRDLET